MSVAQLLAQLVVQAAPGMATVLSTGGALVRTASPNDSQADGVVAAAATDTACSQLGQHPSHSSFGQMSASTITIPGLPILTVATIEQLVPRFYWEKATVQYTGTGRRYKVGGRGAPGTSHAKYGNYGYQMQLLHVVPGSIETCQTMTKATVEYSVYEDGTAPAPVPSETYHGTFHFIWRQPVGWVVSSGVNAFKQVTGHVKQREISTRPDLVERPQKRLRKQAEG